MKLIEEWNGVMLIEPMVFSDSRGWFMETYSRPKMKALGIDTEFVQDNHSFSMQKGVLRGIHYQKEPMSQSKLVRCTRGSILDVAIDLRRSSSMYLCWRSFELSAENKRMLFIPKGFGHAFLTKEDCTEVVYKVDQVYSKEHDRSLRYDDPDIGIDWGHAEPLISEKDRNAPFLKDSDVDFP